MTLIALSILALAVLVSGVAFVRGVWQLGYISGVRRGRQIQLAENRAEIEAAVIAQHRAELLAETWAKRAHAVLFAHFGPGRDP